MDTHNERHFRHLDEKSPAFHQLQALRGSAQRLLATEVLLHFTDHSLSHSDRVADLADELIAPLQSGPKSLQDEELAVLYGACLLHDIGMHAENLQGWTCLSKELTARRWEEMAEDERRTVIRDHHHKVSAELVSRGAEHEGPCRDLPLADLAPERIASLCRAHNLQLEKPDQSAEYMALTPNYGGVRMDLLAAIVRLADILDESHHRAYLDKASVLLLDDASLMHWFHHHYTEAVSFDSANRKVFVEFVFPPAHRKQYEAVVPELQMPHIIDEFRRHEAVLAAQGLHWIPEKKVVDVQYSSKKVMKNSVYLAMLSALQRRGENEEDQRRIAQVQYLREARPAIKTEQEAVEKQRNELPAEEYLRRTWGLADRQRELGGRRCAWMDFAKAYRQVKDALAPQVRVDYGVRLAAWQTENDFAFGAMNTLQETLPLLDQLPPGSPLRFPYHRQRFLALYDLAIHYKDAVDAARQAITVAPSAQAKTDMVCRLAEMSFLVGEPDDALHELQGFAHDSQPNAGTDDLMIASLRWRLQAMSGGLDHALADLSQTLLAGSLDATAKAKTLSLKAELLYADGQMSQALAVFRDELWPMLEGTELPPELAQTVADCYQSVAMNAMEKEPLIEFYEVVDERYLAAIPLGDEHNALLGLDAAEGDKHYDAMAHLVRAARTVYRQGGWSVFRMACARLARESVRVGSLPDAVFYALLARDEKVSAAVAAALRVSRKPEDTRRTVAQLLKFGHLAVHAKVACDLLAEIADEVPDELVRDVAEYLLVKTGVICQVNFSPWEVSRAAWKTLACLVPRLDSSLAERTADAITSAGRWLQSGVRRREMVGVLTNAVPKLPQPRVELLAEQCLPLVTTAKLDFDFHASLELLRRIAERAGEDAKRELALAFYPGRSFGGNGLLLQVASSFGVEPLPKELSALADRLLSYLTGEVLVLAPDAEAPKTSAHAFSRVVDGRKIVTRDTPIALLWGLTRHLGEVPMQKRVALVKAMLSNLRNPDDSLHNKVSTLELLAWFHPHLSGSLKTAVRKCVLALVRGPIRPPTGSPSPEESQHPLQRFRFPAENPTDVTGMAIWCLAKIKEGELRAFGQCLAPVLEHGLMDDSADVRRSTFIALQLRVPRNKAVVERLILGTRDADPAAAAAACYAVMHSSDSELAPSLDSIVYSLTCAARSQDTGLRRAAAALTRRLMVVPGAGQSTALKSLTAVFAMDRCFSVREALHKPRQPYAPATT